MSDPVYTTKLASDFIRTQQCVYSTYDRLQKDKGHRDEAMAALAKRIVPPSMQEGKQIGLWARSGEEEHCFVVKYVRGKYHLSIRGARDEVGLFWFYGKKASSDKQNEWFCVKNIKGSNCILSIIEGSFLFDWPDRVGLYCKVQLPRTPEYSTNV